VSSSQLSYLIALTEAAKRGPRQVAVLLGGNILIVQRTKGRGYGPVRAKSVLG